MKIFGTIIHSIFFTVLLVWTVIIIHFLSETPRIEFSIIIKITILLVTVILPWSIYLLLRKSAFPAPPEIKEEDTKPINDQQQ